MSKKQFTISARNVSLGVVNEDVPHVQSYLRKFGYLDKTASYDGTYDEVTKKALEDFQQNFGLTVTGVLDNKTVEVLEMPRCGVPDKPFNQREGQISSNYNTIGCDYQAKYRVLTYAFANSTPDIPGDGEREAIKNAFITWQKYIPIDFIEVGVLNQPMLSFEWLRGNHGDGYPFDGVGNTLAHAFYPPTCGGRYAGICHFDEDEVWALNSVGTNRDLETVALHEIGHLLGLTHSNIPDSVMFPTYSGKKHSLSEYDIAGIQSLYGRPGPALRVTTHLQGIGDVKYRDNEFSGTRGQSRQLEGFQIEIVTAVPNLSCRYMAHLEGIGDVNFVPEGQFIGTRGQYRRLEGFAIELTGEEAPHYNVIYMAHLQGMGDTGLFTNGEFCGTRGQSRQVEGILVRIEPK